jgi:hypothetical protein
MRIRHFVQGGLVLAAALGIGAQLLPANACTSGTSGTWVTTTSCDDGVTEGTSQGLSASHELRANLKDGNSATAKGLNSSSAAVCQTTDIFEDPFGFSSVSCPATAVKHRVFVN